ncbi:MAG: hypothetical protein WCO57_09630 [Verrucomicrobiota bacterium]
MAALLLGSDGYVLPGPSFYWKPSDEIDVNLIGALFKDDLSGGLSTSIGLRLRTW